MARIWKNCSWAEAVQKILVAAGMGSPALSLVFPDVAGTALDTPLITMGNGIGPSS